MPANACCCEILGLDGCRHQSIARGIVDGKRRVAVGARFTLVAKLQGNVGYPRGEAKCVDVLPLQSTDPPVARLVVECDWPLDGDRPKTGAVLHDGAHIHQAQARGDGSREPCFCSLQPIGRQVSGPTRPRDRLAIAVVDGERRVEGSVFGNDGSCAGQQPSDCGSVALNRGMNRRGVTCGECHLTQSPRHAIE